MTLAQLRYLVAIVDAGLNITMAAERVHATQPGISKQLKQLEDELGFQVFARRGKSLDSVTPAGRQVIERARTILDEATNIRALAANLRGEQEGELRIATTHTQARFVLPGPIAAAKRRYAQVSVHLQPCDDSEVLGTLEQGHADLAVVSSAGEPPTGFVLPAYRWERIVVVPRSHPLAGLRRAPTLAELAAYPLVSYESSLRAESSLRRAFAAAGLEPRLACTARDADLIKTYVRAGLGVGVLAEMALLPEDAEDLCVLPGGNLFPVCTSWIVLRPDRVLREYALEFIVQLAPQIDRRDVRRAFDHGAYDGGWPEPPRWQVLRAAARPGAARSGGSSLAGREAAADQTLRSALR